MKSLFAAIALVAACSVVNAAEVKKDTKAPVLTSKAMTDKDMDKVTAGGLLYVPAAVDVYHSVGSGSPSTNRDPSKGFFNSYNSGSFRGACFNSGCGP